MLQPPEGRPAGRCGSVAATVGARQRLTLLDRPRQAEMGKQLKACVTANRAGVPLPPEQEGLDAGVPADLPVVPLDLQAAAVAEALAHAEAMAHAQVQPQQVRSPCCCHFGCLASHLGDGACLGALLGLTRHQSVSESIVALM